MLNWDFQISKNDGFIVITFCFMDLSIFPSISLLIDTISNNSDSVVVKHQLPDPNITRTHVYYRNFNKSFKSMRHFMVLWGKISMNSFLPCEEVPSAFPVLPWNCSYLLGQCSEVKWSEVFLSSGGGCVHTYCTVHLYSIFSSRKFCQNKDLQSFFFFSLTLFTVLIKCDW
jgi:hypothetical protein